MGAWLRCVRLIVASAAALFRCNVRHLLSVLVSDAEAPMFNLLTSDVLLSFTKVAHPAAEKYGSVTERFVNRQTATETDGSVIIQEAEIQL